MVVAKMPVKRKWVPGLDTLTKAERVQMSRTIHYVGSQWCVTNFGVECRDGKYFFKKTELTQGDGVHDWIDQMRGKGWVNMNDFRDAFAFGRKHYLGIETRPLSRMSASEAAKRTNTLHKGGAL